ncbi:MAG: hypothetical protein KGJ89_00730 [Patescibacteria group bacterium]|nr:hypothetical protein [Patescibacteria group bacterium]MDE2015038.1 hypothetical protein [Patescibacteria group bacterium]MDE2226466.1 hypothetical protein [Patescibacteria group bacterium]
MPIGSSSISLWGIASSIFDLYWTGELIWAVVIIGIATILAFRAIYRKERRFIKNISKRFTIFSLTSVSLDAELDLVKRSGLFNAPGKIETDQRIFDGLDRNQGLLVLAIDEKTNEQTFEQIYRKIEALRKPVIIYTAGNRQIPWLTSDLHAYSFYTIATSPLRLMSDIFTILSTFPND